ncbi:MAG: cell division protein SepF [Oscillospiraceae bacterium]|nr:cell division protein SepF [Oscillospiraceae bacterium]
MAEEKEDTGSYDRSKAAYPEDEEQYQGSRQSFNSSSASPPSAPSYTAQQTGQTSVSGNWSSGNSGNNEKTVPSKSLAMFKPNDLSDVKEILEHYKKGEMVSVDLEKITSKNEKSIFFASLEAATFMKEGEVVNAGPDTFVMTQKDFRAYEG